MRLALAVLAAILVASPVAPAGAVENCDSTAEVMDKVTASIDGMAASLRRRSTKEIIAASDGERRAALIEFEASRKRLLPALDDYSASAARVADAFRKCTGR